MFVKDLLAFTGHMLLCRLHACTRYICSLLINFFATVEGLVDQKRREAYESFTPDPGAIGVIGRTADRS